jgi:hypothetical protein
MSPEYHMPRILRLYMNAAGDISSSREGDFVT